MQPTRGKHGTRFTLTLYTLIVVAFVLRIGSITFQSLWRDETDAICFALEPLIKTTEAVAGSQPPYCQPSDTGLLQRFTQQGFNRPLYFLMLRGWIGLAGDSELAVRFPSLVFGTICVALMVALGTRLYKCAIGLIAGTLLAVSAYQVWYSQEAKMYTFITMLALLAIYSLRRAMEDGRTRWWVTLVVATSLAMYAHILAALLIPVEVVLFMSWQPLSRKRLRPGLIALALLTLPYLPLAVWQLPLVFTPGETGFSHYTLGEMTSILGTDYTTGILNPMSEIPTLLAIGLAATLAVLGLAASPFSHLITWQQSADGKRYGRDTALWPSSRILLAGHRVTRHVPSTMALLAWLAIPLLSIFIVSINRPIFTDRYLIWIAPAYYLLIALGVDTLWRWWRPLAVSGLAALIVVSVLNIQHQATTPFKSDFRAVAATMTREIQPGDVIVFQIPYVQFTFDYYFRRPYESMAGPYTNYPGNNDGYLETPAMVFQQLAATFQGRGQVWLVASEVPMWDARDLLRTWLSAHGEITYQASFAQVQITRYQLSDP